MSKLSKQQKHCLQRGLSEQESVVMCRNFVGEREADELTSVLRLEDCGHCDGTGRDTWAGEEIYCHVCEGYGQLTPERAAKLRIAKAS
jgi:DnaJ-class molecular chaperone